MADRLFVIKPLDYLIDQGVGGFKLPDKSDLVSTKILKEEGVVIDVAEKSSPSVVTVSIQTQQRVIDPFSFDPFNLFGNQSGTRTEQVQQDIGTGFVVENGLIVTNKHVVANTEAKYKVIDKDDKEYEVTNIYRDPVNDLAILQIQGATLPTLELGNSDNLKVGQFVVAIGTALGEFRHTVTTGVISGLGRGIEAGSPLQGQTEALDNVIQTDAAINPGNSGGPLINSAGQVIGVNVAIAGNAQNIGFAIPINVIKESLTNFEQTGEFDRPRLGVTYQMISRQLSVLNEIPEGAYVREVTPKSAADEAGVKVGDIIIEMDGKRLSEVKGGLAGVVGNKKIGDSIKMRLWREGQEAVVEARLKATD